MPKPPALSLLLRRDSTIKMYYDSHRFLFIRINSLFPPFIVEFSGLCIRLFTSEGGGLRCAGIVKLAASLVGIDSNIPSLSSFDLLIYSICNLSIFIAYLWNSVEYRRLVSVCRITKTMKPSHSERGR